MTTQMRLVATIFVHRAIFEKEYASRIHEPDVELAMDYYHSVLDYFNSLKEVGKTKKPVLLKRGLANTIEEWLMSAEYIMSEGNENIILCERGIRTYETYTRNTLDLSAVPVLHELTHLPVVVDPSHGTGKAKLVPSMALAAAAAGSDGIMVEVHNNPSCALCDGSQSLTPAQFAKLNEKYGR